MEWTLTVLYYGMDVDWFVQWNGIDWFVLYMEWTLTDMYYGMNMH